jgi:ABC-type branched-subunit amino acid transport system ATPase component
MVGALFERDRRERGVATEKLRADEMLSHLGLDGADRPAATLNIVDRKRLALARALPWNRNCCCSTKSWLA